MFKKNFIASFGSRNIYLTILLFGIFLRIFQYLFNRSLWLDEASLALSIVDPMVSIFRPLPYDQSAPILFLILERFFIMLFGTSEYALRAFPLIISILSLPLMRILAFRITKNEQITNIALFIFAFSPYLIYYASEVKQYSSDVFVLLVLMTLALNSLSLKRKYLLLTLVGVISIFLSHISVFVLFCIYLYLFWTILVKRKMDWLFVVSSVILLFAFGVNYFFFINGHPVKTFMLEFWQRGFMPVNPMRLDFWYWFAEIFYVYFKKLFFGQAQPGLLTIYIYIGLIQIITLLGIYQQIKKRDFVILYFLLFPIVFHLFVSALKVYPFYNRLVLYLAPLIFIQAAIGIYFCYQWINKNTSRQIAKLFVSVLLAVYGVVNIFAYPIEIEEIKQSILFLEENIEKDDKILVTPGAYRAFEYYNKTGRVKSKNIVSSDPESLDNPEELFHYLQLNPKERIWVVYSHPSLIGMKYSNQAISNYFKENAQLKQEHKSKGSRVELYRIKD